MLSTGAVVSGSGIALEGITEVATVKVVVPQVIMASPEEGQQKRRFTVSYRSSFFFSLYSWNWAMNYTVFVISFFLHLNKVSLGCKVKVQLVHTVNYFFREALVQDTSTRVV